MMHLEDKVQIQHLKNSFRFCTYSAEVFVGACFPAEPALEQHVLQLVTEASHHLRGIDAVIWVWTVVFEVQQVEETLLVAIFEDGQALLHHRVIRIHEVHPVAAVIQVILGQCGRTKHVFIAESNSWEGHVVSPNHVDLCDSRVGHQV